MIKDQTGGRYGSLKLQSGSRAALMIDFLIFEINIPILRNLLTVPNGMDE